MSIVISGATIIDGITDKPIEGDSIWIEGARIKAIGRREELAIPSSETLLDGRGKYLIPGLMNANVHLLQDVRLENLAHYRGRFEDLIIEAAQVALKSGLTTVFDTWGPRRCLMTVRDRIAAGEIPGSRIFCAGNIIGLEGPFSQEFFPKALEVASAAFARRINSMWVENTGAHLMRLPPEQVAKEVRTYIGKGIDFIKYASNEHGFPGAAFIAFSPQVQAAMVAEAHRAGITAQAHTVTGEGLRIAVEAGCDLIQHPNISGPIPIPAATFELMAQRKTGAAVFPWTKKGLDWIMEHAPERDRTMWQASDINVRGLIRSGAPLLLANDGAIFAPEITTDPLWGKGWVGAPADESLSSLLTGHFVWLKAMEEKGCPPMDMLKAATRNIAVAYGKDRDLGTLEPGKLADILVLDKNPLQAAENYRSIHMIIKDGAIVDRNALPVEPLLTRPMEPPAEEEASYVPFLVGGSSFPMCPMCKCS